MFCSGHFLLLTSFEAYLSSIVHGADCPSHEIGAEILPADPGCAVRSKSVDISKSNKNQNVFWKEGNNMRDDQNLILRHPFLCSLLDCKCDFR